MHHLSLKIATLVTAAFLAATGLLELVLHLGLTLQSIGTLTLVVAAVGYGSAHLLLARRLRAIRESTALIRVHAFEALKQEPTRRGDELDALHEDVRLTGAAFEK
ncbi:MAG TPA: hypothetical protein VF190_09070, partial [Rhodothermales bacterium]